MLAPVDRVEPDVKLADRIRPLLRKVAPVAKVVQATTNVLGQLKEPTVYSVANAVSGGLKSLDEIVSPSGSYNWQYQSLAPYGMMIEGLRRAGAEIIENREEREHSTAAYDGERHVRVSDDGSLMWQHDPKGELFEWCRKAADAVLPPAMWVTSHKHDLCSTPYELTTIDSDHAYEIWERTRHMLDGGRAILLEGKPGVGKTTIAQAIARISGLGRAVVFDPQIFMRESRGFYLDEHMLQMLSPGVVIVDDLDKMDLALSTLELLRQNSRLVILTANNGSHDTVLDGALMRPARIDEVFTITSAVQGPRPPFDQLTLDEWNMVREWPTAYLNEVAKRLQAHPDDLRLEDLRDRVKRRTKSGSILG